jgi:SCP-2 sterol transfer family protein
VLKRCEFMSPTWIAMAREQIIGVLAGKDLRTIRFTLCEEFTNPPEHLRPSGAQTIGFYVRLGDGQVEVGDRPINDADCTIISDYADALALARDPDAAAADPAVMAERMAAGRLKIIGDLSAAPAVLTELNIHKLLAPHTA